mgnify:FL=1
MIDTIYYENDIKEHHRTLRILSKFKNVRKISIDRYSELFNKRNQNFKIQKKNPSLILAKKHKGFVLPAPEGFGIGGNENYYFSHMYNCIYDCRYCFLQGMYSSANFVLFVNFEDFDLEIKSLISKNKNITFFSGYDCDSLALENITGFASHILPLFRDNPLALLEFRTKSIQIKPLDKITPIDNCIMAYSLMPDKMSLELDKKAPTIKRRISTIKKLSEMGWKIGLRFDPLIYGKNWKDYYRELHEEIYSSLNLNTVHSISYGPLRFPSAMYNKIFDLYPEEKLFTGPFEQNNKVISYKKEVEEEMTDYCQSISLKHLPKSIIFKCNYEN